MSRPLNHQSAALTPLRGANTNAADAHRGAPGWLLALLGFVLALAVLGAGGLWVYYGTAVFFDLVAAGIAACF